jgi:hypothetical protein
MIARRALLAALGALGLDSLACGGARAGAHAGRPDVGAPGGGPGAATPPLRLDPLVDLTPAVDLTWLVHARPSAWRDRPAWTQAAEVALPAGILDALRADGAGVDWRQSPELVAAGFSGATLLLVRTPFEPARVEQAFAQRALAVEGRAVERGVTRLWGTARGAGERIQIALFGHDAIAIEQGRFGPLRVAAYFAEGRLKRSPSALRASPLAELAAPAARMHGIGGPDAPLRFFAPGPFAEPWAAGLGGLLRSTTAVGVRFTPAAAPADKPSAIDARLVLAGAWGDAWPRAAERLDAFFRVMTEDPLAHLMGLDHPLAEVLTTGDPSAIALDVRLDGGTLAQGIRATTTASLAEILGKPAASSMPH